MARSPLVFLLLLVAGCSGYKPRMTPDKLEIIINEGDELVIKCRSNTAFKIIFPETKIGEYITSEHDIIYEENEEMGLIKQIFQRKSTVHGDSGWYGCVDESVDEADQGNFDDPNANWIYVYVESKKHLFVSELETQVLNAFSGDTLVLPCRPTSPALDVNLKLDFEPVEMGERVSFDPKKGFTIKRIQAIDSGSYFCTIDRGNEEEDSVDLTIHIMVYRKRILRDPFIDTENLRYVIKGSELNVTCTAEVGDAPYKLSWITPTATAFQKVYSLPPQKTYQDTRLATSVLNIQSVAYDDEGEYVCELQSQNTTIRTAHYIKVYDPAYRHINLTSHMSDRLLQVDEGSSVTFAANIEGYPQPTLIWVKHDLRRNLKKEIITSSPGVIVENTKSYASLHINRVHPMYAGIYTLEAFHNDSLSSIERLNFTLEVRAKPSVILSDDDDIAFFSINQTANFTCKAYNNPPANVSIFYYKCSNYPMIMEDCEIVQLESTAVEDTPTEKEIRVQFQTEKIGAVRCTACNKLGCDSKDLPLFLTDGVPNQTLGIISDLEIVTTNANITFTCIAPIYNVSAVEWQDRNYEPIRNKDRIQVTLTSTTYTRRAILSITDVYPSDEGDYVCISVSSDGNAGETLVHHLEVHDFMEPVNKSTYANGSEIERQVDKPHNIRLVSYPKRKSYPKYYLV